MYLLLLLFSSIHKEVQQLWVLFLLVLIRTYSSRYSSDLYSWEIISHLCAQTKYLPLFINGRIIHFAHKTNITWHTKNLNYKLRLLMKRSWKCPQLLNCLSCILPNYRLEQCPQNRMVQHTSTRERAHQNALVHLQPLEKARTSFSTAGKTRTTQAKHTEGFQFTQIKVMSRMISAPNEKTQTQSSSWASLPT